MIIVTIYKDCKGSIQKYNVKGHANYDEHGKDIVCAAVSMLAQTILISLFEVCGLKEKQLDYFIDEKDGILDVEISKDLPLDTFYSVDIVLRTFETGIKSISENYSKNVTLKYKEV